MKHTGRGVLVIGMMMLMAGCAQAVTPAAPDVPPPSPSETAPASTTQAVPSTPTPGGSQVMTPSVPTPAGSGLQNLIDQAKQDLAQRLGVSVDEITLLEAESVTWPDGSLGCPQPGMEYAQVLTPGYLIRLAAGDREFEYHTGMRSTLVTCQDPVPPFAGTPPDV